MPRLTEWLALATLGALALLASAPAAADDSEKPERKECVEVKAEARPSGYAFNHLVHLKNACKETQRCEVSTDVNPDVQTVTLAGGELKTLITYRGSPSRTFEPKVSCKPTGS